MKLVIDIPFTEDELKQEIAEQIEEFKRNGLLPITDDGDSNESKVSE